MGLITTLLAVAAMGVGGQMQETPAQRDARMGWWREARFGMFIHWGLYAIPAGEWNGGKDYGEWIRDSARIPIDVYDRFKDQFNPVKFDADAWVRMAKDAGMKYIVITTKHHDGFALFDSKHTDWDVMSTPYGKDLMKQLAEACRRHGVRMCWYHSIMDWHHPDYLPRRPWEASSRSADGAKMDRYVEFLRNQVTELLTNYGDIGVVWFDGEWESTWNDGYGRPLYELCRKLQPNVIVNNRVSNNRGGSMEDATTARVGDFTTPEQHIPPTGLPGVDWETCMTMNDHWGWNKNNHNWKSSTQLIRNLVDIASKGGNYLLNVGPTAEGEFPQESVVRLREIGEWMKVNGEAIYKTTASLFDSLPWGRTTTKRAPGGSTLYLHVFEWPKDGRLVLPGIGNEPKRVTLLGSGAKVEVKRAESDLVFQLPSRGSNPHSTTLKVELDGDPIIYRPPTISAPSQLLIDSVAVRMSSGSNAMQVRYTLDGAEPTAKSPVASQVLRIDRTCVLKAASFRGGKRLSPVVESRFTKVVPAPAVRDAGAKKGLTMEVFRGDWDRLPDFSKLSAVSSEAVREISPGNPGEYVGRRYTGYFDVPKDGVYTFALTSDDGSALWIDGQKVIDNDGLHAAVTVQTQLALAKGLHRLELGWFNKTGGYALELMWGKAGARLGPVSD